MDWQLLRAVQSHCKRHYLDVDLRCDDNYQQTKTVLGYGQGARFITTPLIKHP